MDAAGNSPEFAQGRLLREGKTKQIYETNNPDVVLVRCKDDITAGDGKRHDVIAGKGTFSATTTSNLFDLLGFAGIPTHFIRQLEPDSFLAEAMQMLPLELVVRRRPYASYLKRNPWADLSTVFTGAVFEIYEKNEQLHDPLHIYNFVDGTVRRFRADVAFAEGFIDERPLTAGDLDLKLYMRLHDLAISAFRIVESAWKTHNIELADAKLECGYNAAGELKLADELSNDGWRLWPAGDPAMALDKQVYRDLPEVTPEGLEIVRSNYALTATLSHDFGQNRDTIVTGARELQSAGKN